MKNNALNKPVGVTVIAVLALAQAVFGVLRALDWFEIGSDFLGRGLLILPLIGVVAYARGLLVAGIALLYVMFALGVFGRKSWARSLGLTAAVVNLLLVLSVVVQGESLIRAILWIIVPVIIVWYLLGPGGGAAYKPK
jgi:hypothetical protein